MIEKYEFFVFFVCSQQLAGVEFAALLTDRYGQLRMKSVRRKFSRRLGCFCRAAQDPIQYSRYSQNFQLVAPSFGLQSFKTVTVGLVRCRYIVCFARKSANKKNCRKIFAAVLSFYCLNLRESGRR